MHRLRDCLALAVILTPLLWTAGSGVQASCEADQEALIACVVDVASSISPGVGMEDVTLLCGESRDLLRCVAVARAACPNMELLEDPAFSRAVDLARTEYNKYCTDDGMSNDSPARCDVSPWSNRPECQTATTVSPTATNETDCDYNPVDAMVECNMVMAGVPPGNLEAMCGRRGEEFLQCMTDIVGDCPQHEVLLNFDLEMAINTTRYMLQHQCSENRGNCVAKLNEAQRQCAHSLSDGTGDYCTSLVAFMRCLDDTLLVCPDQELIAQIRNQYEHHCPTNSDVTCPSDLRGAMEMCFQTRPTHNIPVPATFCRMSMDFLLCADDLANRCHADTRLPELYVASSIRDTRVWMSRLCNENGGMSSHAQTS